MMVRVLYILVIQVMTDFFHLQCEEKKNSAEKLQDELFVRCKEYISIKEGY